ncbi:NAD(P)H-dependent oxidoreductase [Roseomonas sp. HJA6]|uniref:NAD(P)H-dependent oxidoreductase n=2 Tax=Roseomonas alba TaxID=2846776 RepID=A0ABS7A822_9PROT|nr:NAD(P)H-dependent oxidoreductase [Neoroseomonas alba]
MRVLMIQAHPRADSYSAALRDAARGALEAAGHTVELRDLYAEGFAPALSAAEHAVNMIEGANEAGIEDHVAALRRAEALVLVYPTWWYGMPAMLKGWFDRIWSPGIAFRLGEGAIEPLLTDIRRIAVVTTYGSPLWLLWWIGWPDYKLISRGIRRLCGKGCRLDWVSLHDMDRRQRPELDAFVTKIHTHFSRW